MRTLVEQGVSGASGEPISFTDSVDACIRGWASAVG